MQGMFFCWTLKQNKLPHCKAAGIHVRWPERGSLQVLTLTNDMIPSRSWTHKWAQVLFCSVFARTSVLIRRWQVQTRRAEVAVLAKLRKRWSFVPKFRIGGCVSWALELQPSVQTFTLWLRAPGLKKNSQLKHFEREPEACLPVGNVLKQVWPRCVAGSSVESRRWRQSARTARRFDNGEGGSHLSPRWAGRWRGKLGQDAPRGTRPPSSVSRRRQLGSHFIVALWNRFTLLQRQMRKSVQKISGVGDSLRELYSRHALTRRKFGALYTHELWPEVRTNHEETVKFRCSQEKLWLRSRAPVMEREFWNVANWACWVAHSPTADLTRRNKKKNKKCLFHLCRLPVKTRRSDICCAKLSITALRTKGWLKGNIACCRA